MRKVMQQIKVSVRDDGDIWISQPAGLGYDEDAIVSISPDQVDLLVQWLKEAQAEASKIVSEQHSGAE